MLRGERPLHTRQGDVLAGGEGSPDDLVPWRHPARRELQFGEWLRGDLEAGIVEPLLVVTIWPSC